MHDNRNRLDVGTRVRNWNHLYWGASAWGTGTIVAVVTQHSIDDTWEYLVRADRDGELHQWNIVDTPEQWLADMLADTPNGKKYLARIERVHGTETTGRNA